MKKDTMPHEPTLGEPDGGSESDSEPVILYRTTGWAFLPPAFAAISYGVLHVFAGLGSGTAILISVLFTLALLFSPEKTCPDWCGLCFTTGAVGLFAIGHPVSHVLGGIAAIFAVMTVFDESATLTAGRRLALLGTYVLAAGLSSAVYFIATWVTVGLALLYLLFHMMLKLLPLGIAAEASLRE